MRVAFFVLALMLAAAVQASIQRTYGIGHTREDTSNSVEAQACLNLEELHRNMVRITNKCNQWVSGELETVKCNGGGGYIRQPFTIGNKGDIELETSTHEFSNRPLFCHNVRWAHFE